MTSVMKYIIIIKTDIVLHILSVTCRCLPHMFSFSSGEGNKGNKQVVDSEEAFLTDTVCFTA